MEIDYQHDYNACKDLGKTSSPKGHEKIRVHFVFYLKQDGRHKARLVADGHLTDVPLSSVCSEVVSLRGMRMVLFIAELNRLDLWGSDIGNACLDAFTKGKACTIASPEFGPLQGHTLIIDKTWCGLRTSVLR